jgi:PST family polysaccharide transporter
MAFTPFAYSLVNGYGINYLLQVGKEKVFKNIILLCSVLGFILLFVLIPFFSFYGAAATVLIIYFLKGIISRHYALKLIK